MFPSQLCSKHRIRNGFVPVSPVGCFREDAGQNVLEIADRPPSKSLFILGVQESLDAFCVNVRESSAGEVREDVVVQVAPVLVPCR